MKVHFPLYLRKLSRSVPCLAVILLTSCTNSEGDFTKAQQANTEEAYAEFIQKHSKSPLVADAKARIEQNAYEAARKSATVAAYEAFLKRFETGDLSRQVKGELEAIEFSEASKTATVTKWEDFLRRYPQSTNAPHARTTLVRLEYDTTLKANDISSLEGFLAKHGDSELATEVKARLDSQLEERDWNAALLKNTRQAYRDFSKAHPSSTRIRIATGTMEGAVRIVGAGGRILLGSGDETFRIIAPSNRDFPAIQIGGNDAIRLGFIPVGTDGEFSMDYQSRYLYNDSEAIALKETSGDYRLIHFSCSQITKGPGSETPGGLTVSGGSRGRVAKDFVVGPPTLPP